MSYAAALDSLHALAGELYAPSDAPPGAPRRKFDLAQMRVLTAALGNPERKFPSVLVAGTNGKGSTSATLAAILTAAGYRTGLYTSPHLTRVNERLRISGPRIISGPPIADPEPAVPRLAPPEFAGPDFARPDSSEPDFSDDEIADADFARLYFQVDDAARALVSANRLPTPPSFFETMTAVAFLAFADAAVDIAILEVGMGGRLDATNIVDPLLSVITDISLDHTEWLGPTISAIAREKAGILRPGGVLITLPQHPEANQAIGEAAVALNVRGINAAEYMPARAVTGETGDSYPLTVLGRRIQVASPLHGAHQQRNIALAIAAAVELSNDSSGNIDGADAIRRHHCYKLTASQIEQGIRATRWPARLERIPQPGHADVLLDVAHNPAGAWALRAALSHIDKHHSTPEITILFGCLRDKPVAEIAQILFPLAARVILTEVPSPRAASLAEMQLAAEATGVAVTAAADPVNALRLACELTPPTGLIVITGSVYLIGALRPRLIGALSPEPIPALRPQLITEQPAASPLTPDANPESRPQATRAQANGDAG
jgi:dihydrofolate synthase/folylpolyglutamate synthase